MASKNEKAGRQPVTHCNRLGNTAKMREARNCDRFSNANEALEAFANEKAKR